MVRGRSPARARAEALDGHPAMLAAPPWRRTRVFEAGDPERDELRQLLGACLVGADRRGLREQMRAKGGCETR